MTTPEIISGPISRPSKTILYGLAGIGKTTLAAHLTELGLNPIFIDTENGSFDVDVSRFVVRSKAQWDAVIKQLTTEAHNFNIAVIDTVTSLEPMIEKVVLAEAHKARMGDFDFGKGSILLREHFNSLLFLQLDELIAHGIHVFVIGHTKLEHFTDPQLLEGWDRYTLAMDNKVSATLRQWADNVLFASWDFYVTENERKETRGLRGKDRFIFTTHSATYDAKNRANLPEKIPFKAEALKPLFTAPMAKNGAGRLPDELLSAWGGLSAAIAQAGIGQPEFLRFLESRYPSLKTLEDWPLIPADYIRAALKRTDSFISVIQEFLNEPPTNDPTQTAQTEPVSTTQS